MNNIQYCFLKTKKKYLKFLKKEKILKKYTKHQMESLKKFYIPLSFWIEKQYKKKGKTLFLGLSGGQGSGKTTMSKILKIILKNFFKREVHISSIDDFYKTHKHRQQMSKTIHPLFKTRGVPGTHETQLLKRFFIFAKKTNFKKFKLPKFDKSIDDRLKQEHCIKVKKKPNIVILEGWCVGAKSQKRFLLKKPVNILEKYEDENCVWRKYANEQLKKEYKKVTGDSLSLTKDGDSDILVQSISRVRTSVQASQYYKIGGLKGVEPAREAGERKVDDAIKKWLEMGKKAPKPKNVTRK